MVGSGANSYSADYEDGTEPLRAQTLPLQSGSVQWPREAGLLTRAAAEAVPLSQSPRHGLLRWRPLHQQHFRGDAEDSGSEGLSALSTAMAGRRRGAGSEGTGEGWTQRRA